MRNKIKHIAIVGLGLIGGSLVKALKSKGYRITGITRKKDILKIAKKERAIDHGYTEVSHKSLNNVDIIFLATPLSTIPNYIKKISKIIKHEVILTDVGSTKFEICKTADKILPKNITFIGGHPMAGTENSGFKFAQKNLFKKCVWVLTPQKKDKEALKILQNIIKQTGAIPIVSDPKKHDKAVAFISHMPLLASIGLCQIVKNTKDKELTKLATILASSGFRDTTRIAGGNAQLNIDLITANSNELKKLLPKYVKEIKTILKTKKELKTISKWRKQIYDKSGKNIFLQTRRRRVSTS